MDLLLTYDLFRNLSNLGADMLVYLAGPIDDIDIGDAKGWRERAKELLAAGEITVFDPATVVTYNRFDYPSEAKRVVKITEVAVDMADYLLVNLAGPGLALGTIREIERARGKGKGVMVWTTNELKSFYAADLEAEYALVDCCWQLVTKSKKYLEGGWEGQEAVENDFGAIYQEQIEGVSYDREPVDDGPESMQDTAQHEAQRVQLTVVGDRTHNVEILANVPTEAGLEFIDRLEQDIREVVNTRVNEWHFAQAKTR